ncbi:MAG: ester cyclase [Pseudomonadota bacterium]
MTPLRIALAALAALALPAQAQDAASNRGAMEGMRQVSTHQGEMAMTVEMAERIGLDDVNDALRFEPFQQFEEMFFRDDVVWLMRHGPTDWSNLDMKDVAPADCANQLLMIEEGIQSMRDLGTLLAVNEVLPSRIVVSEWCRNQQTVEAMLEGMDRYDPAIGTAMPVETDPGLNLLLSLQGSQDATPLRERVSAWEGDPERPGPLLVVSHYTNIEEMTQFRVFEGEILVIDPQRDNLVLGYVRLRSANPDVGHFADALASPLMGEDAAMDMVERYYAALNENDDAQMMGLLAEDWTGYGLAAGPDGMDADGLRGLIDGNREGMSDMTFSVDDLHVSDDVVTVIGRITGTHTGELLGVPATGRPVEFGTIVVHRIEEGRIVESWISSDRLDLMEQIKG